MLSALSDISWSAENIGSIGIIFFTFVGAYMLFLQNRQIWKSRSGESVSVFFMGYFLCMQFVIAVYGFETGYLPLQINGIVRGLCYPPILFGLWRFKGFTRSEWILLSVCACAAACMPCLPGALQPTFYSVYLIGFGVAAAFQPIELIKTKSPGAVNIWLLWIFFLANIFWIFFGLAVNDWALITINFVLFAEITFTIILWYFFRIRYRRSF